MRSMRRLIVNILLLCFVISSFAVTLSKPFTYKIASSISVAYEEKSPMALTPEVVVSASVNPLVNGSQIMEEDKANMKRGCYSNITGNQNISFDGQSANADNRLRSLASRKISGNAVAAGGSSFGLMSSLNGGIYAEECVSTVSSLSALNVSKRNGPPGGGSSTGELPIQDAWLWMAVLTAGYAGVLLRRSRRKRTAGNGRTI